MITIDDLVQTRVVILIREFVYIEFTILLESNIKEKRHFLEKAFCSSQFIRFNLTAIKTIALMSKMSIVKRHASNHTAWHFTPLFFLFTLQIKHWLFQPSEYK